MVYWKHTKPDCPLRPIVSAFNSPKHSLAPIPSTDISASSRRNDIIHKKHQKLYRHAQHTRNTWTEHASQFRRNFALLNSEPIAETMKAIVFRHPRTSRKLNNFYVLHTQRLLLQTSERCTHSITTITYHTQQLHDPVRKDSHRPSTAHHLPSKLIEILKTLAPVPLTDRRA